MVVGRWSVDYSWAEKVWNESITMTFHVCWLWNAYLYIMSRWYLCPYQRLSCLPTTYRPLTNHLPTTYWPTTYRPLTDHLPTTYRPPTDHFFTVQLVHDYPANLVGSGCCIESFVSHLIQLGDFVVSKHSFAVICCSLSALSFIHNESVLFLFIIFIVAITVWITAFLCVTDNLWMRKWKPFLEDKS